MRSSVCLRVAIFTAALCLSPHHAESADAPADDASPPLAEWIWRDGDAESAVVLQTTVTLPHRAQQARLRALADFCAIEIRVNSETAVVIDHYSPLAELDVLPFLQPGENQIEITANGSDGPSAVAVELELVAADGTRESVVTDDSWTLVVEGIAKGPAKSNGPVAPELWGRNGRSIEISPFDNYEQWRLASGDEADSGGRFWAAPGFEFELVRAAGEDEGSWVSVAFDPRGRAVIAREGKGLLRFTFDEPGGEIVQVETINDSLEECRGLLFVGDDLYANANNSKGVYLLAGAGGDGPVGEPQLIGEFPGGVGHGRNQLKLGPDGRIYSICGDAVDLPKDVFDRTSPFREARRGPSPGEGFVAVYDRESTKWELLCAGMRNPFGIAFNADGEAFTYDADAEFDMGAPWYRPTRILHLVSGADYGWRAVTTQWPPYDPDHPANALPILDIGKGSPTAAEFGYRSNFPPRYKNALFVLDWAYGRVLAVHLRPRGATYLAQAETFLQGQPLNVCCLDFGPDGAMYLVTGGRGTKSGLYRVTWNGGDTAADIESEHQRLCLTFGDESRDTRHRLEESHGRPELADEALIWQQLDAADPVLRYAARTALEHLPVDDWREQALSETRTTASLEALTALARHGDAGDVDAIVERSLKHDLSQLTLTQQLTLLHIWQRCRQVDPMPLHERRETILAQVRPIVTGASPQRISPLGDSERLRREAARVLKQLESPDTVRLLIERLTASRTQEDRLHYLFLLRDVDDGWSDEAHHVYFAALQEAGGFVRGEGMPSFLKLIRDEAFARLSDEERDRFAALIESQPHNEPPPLETRPVVKKWTVDDLDELLGDGDRPGDAEQGKAVFHQAACTKCHRVGATGPAVGPDLTYLARRFSRRDMLLSILEPDRVVAENYRNVEVVTKQGRVFTGRPAVTGDFRSQTLKIVVDPLRATEFIELDKRNIEVHRLAETSPMPKGLLDTFTAEEIRNLLAYLESGGSAKR